MCMCAHILHSHLTILPDLWVRLSAALDLLHQGSEGLQGAGVDKREALPLFKSIIGAQTQTPATQSTHNHQITNRKIYIYIQKLRYLLCAAPDLVACWCKVHWSALHSAPCFLGGRMSLL